MSETVTEDHRFPCPACGSDLRYEPGTAALKCDHCGAERAVEDIGPSRGETIREVDYRRAIREQLPASEIEETRVIRCPSCGAQVEMGEDTHAAECPFCATPVVTDTGTHRHIKPHAVLPFKMAEREARAALTRWLGRLWFAPGGVQDFARKGRRMRGVYVPFWTYDADTKSRYTGQRGDAYTVQESYTATENGKQVTRTRSVRKIRWSPVSGRVARFFDDVLVLASKGLPKGYTDALAPWDLEELRLYTPEYLAGFEAEGYQVELEDGYKEARAIMERQIRRDVRADIGGDEQRIGDLDTEVGTLRFKHVLLPVWLAAYKFRGKSYRFVVNGRTGKVQGERPYSAWKIALAVLVTTLIALAVGYWIAQGQ